MGQGGRDGDRGSINFDIGEPFSGNPNLAPGFPRPIGWRVREPDGTAAYDKVGPADTDWQALGTGAAGVDPDVGNTDMILDLDMQGSGNVIVGSAVHVAKDFSTYGNDADQADDGLTQKFPTFNPAGINGLPTMTVGNAETKGIGRNNIPAPNWLVSNSNYTLICACKSNGPNGPLPFIPGYDGISFPRISFGAYSPSAGVQDFIASFTGGFTAVPYTDPLVNYAGIPIILTVRCLANVVTVRINGFTRTIGALTGSDAVAFRSFVLGLAGGDGTETEVGQARFFKVGLTDTELAEREGFFGAKWRIALTPVAPPFVESVTALDASAFDETNPQKPVLQRATTTNAGLLQVFATPVFNWLTTATPTDVPLPVVAGKTWRTVAVRWDISTLTGTATSPLTSKWQHNGADFPGSPPIYVLSLSAASINNLGPGNVSILIISTIPIPDISAAHALQWLITAAPAGLTALTGRLVVVGYYE